MEGKFWRAAELVLALLFGIINLYVTLILLGAGQSIQPAWSAIFYIAIVLLLFWGPLLVTALRLQRVAEEYRIRAVAISFVVPWLLIAGLFLLALALCATGF